MVQKHASLKLRQESLYRAVGLLDRYLSVSRADLHSPRT